MNLINKKSLFVLRNITSLRSLFLEFLSLSKASESKDLLRAIRFDKGFIEGLNVNLS